MDYYYWTSVDALNTTKEFGRSPSSVLSASRSGALEPFASPQEALEALFQNHGYTSWEPPTTTSATAIVDQASFPPSVFVFSGSPSTYSSTESRSGEAQTTTLFDSSLVEQMSDKFDNTKLGGDVDYGTLSLPAAKSPTTHELLHDRCPANASNTLRPVKPIKGMIRKHKQYLTVCYRGLHLPHERDSHLSTYQSLDMTRPNVCMYCLARFERQSDCDRHIRSHSNEAQYWCHNPDCPIDHRFTQYTRSDARQRHWEKHVECWEWYYRSPIGVEYLEENGQRLRKFPPSILKAFVAQGIELPKPRAPPKAKMSPPPVEQPKRTPAQKRVRSKALPKTGKRRISQGNQPHRGMKSCSH